MIVLAIVALTAGFLVTVVVAVTLLAALVSSKLLGRPLIRIATRPVRRSSPATRRPEAIDVTATEVESSIAPLRSLSKPEDYGRPQFHANGRE
ncbi:MAG: hypothetical protein ABIV50_00080 [Opitutus sp.]